MAKSSPSVAAHVMIQAYAFVFLLLGGGLGAVLGKAVGAATDGSSTDLTIVPRGNGPDKQFNWLLFEIGLAAGLISCAVLLAASFRSVPASDA